MITILRTDSANPDFIKLVQQLDEDLARRDGDDNAFYSQFNKIAPLKHTVVAYEDNEPIGSGAIKEYQADSMEVKRMYALPTHRGKGLATKILQELERWSAEMGYSCCVLETGKRQPEAIALYKKNGYTIIENYGQYAGIENSLCFKKELV